MANEAVHRVIADYYRDFSTLNVEAILPYFHEPSLLVGPQGVIALPDRRAAAAVFGQVMDGLRAKGYGRSEFEPARVDLLSQSVALVVGVAARYKTGGAQLERVGVTYLLHGGEKGWKFATVIIHDAKTQHCTTEHPTS